MSQLTQLRVWDMGYNYVNGTLPTGFGSLSDLQVFVMTKNQLTGTIPTDLCANSSLTDVFLGGNRLSGAFDTAAGGPVSSNLPRNKIVIGWIADFDIARSSKASKGKSSPPLT